MQFRKQTLDNGLEIVAECNPEARTTALGFFVKSGARDETDDVSGVSHFLEHMVFKGTPSRSAEQVNLEFDAMGADYNAFTSEEQTVYHAVVLPEYTGRALELLADILRPSLRQEDFDTEKKVIIEEIRMYLDQPPYGADDVVRQLHYGKHPLGRSVLGTVDSITQLPVDKMRAYFERRYSPSNITLVAAGNLDFDAFQIKAEQACRSWKPLDAPRDVPPATGANKFEVVHKPQSTQEYMIQISDGPSATDADRYAAKLLSAVIGDDCGSRFFWDLVDPGYAETVSLSHHDGLGAGAFFCYLACDPEFTADNLKRIRDVYAAVESDGVTEQELAQVKSKVNSRIVLGSERPSGRLFSVGSNWSQRREYRTVAEAIKLYDAPTVDDLRTVVKKFPLSRNTTVCVGPLETLS